MIKALGESMVLQSLRMKSRAGGTHPEGLPGGAGF